MALQRIKGALTNGRRLAAAMRKLTLLDCLSLGLILTHALLLTWNGDLLPFGYDTPYHLLMGKMFADYDRVVLWDYYEFAPLGRPQLYPPFEHIVIWFTHDLFHLDYVQVGRLIAIVQYPLTLFTCWLVTRALVGEFVAAAFLGLLSADLRFWGWQLTVAPTALILALYFPFVYFFIKKRRIPSILLLTAFLYSHLGLPYVILLSLLIFVLVAYRMDRSYVKEFAIVAGASLLLFSPWAAHILANRGSISANLSAGRMPLLGFLFLNLPTLILLPIGLYACAKGKETGKMLIGNFLGFFSMLFTYGWRYFLHSGIINSAVSALGYQRAARRLLKRFGRKALVGSTVGFVLLISVFNPSIVPKGSTQGPRPRGSIPVEITTPLIREFTSMTSTEPQAWGAYRLNNPDLQAVAEWISENTREDDIIHVTVGPLADSITLLTGRRTDSGMYREVRPEETFRAIEKGTKSGIFVTTQQDFLRKGMFSLRAEVLARFGEYVIFHATGVVPPEKVLAVPVGLYIRLKRVDGMSPQELDAWKSMVAQVRPERLSVGIHQADAGSDALARLLSEVRGFSKALEVSLFVEDPGRVEDDMRALLNSCGQMLIAIRAVGKASALPTALLREWHSTASALGMKFGVGILGLPVDQQRAWNRPELAAREVDYVVRHAPPSADVVLHVVGREVEALELGDKPYFIQIDTSLVSPKETIPSVLNLLRAAQETAASGTFIEISNPFLPREVVGLLSKVFHP